MSLQKEHAFFTSASNQPVESTFSLPWVQLLKGHQATWTQKLDFS